MTERSHPVDFDAGLAALDAVVEELGQVRNRNESETRFQIIDRIITEILGWDHADVRIERRLNGRFTDYELGMDPALAIIEAKREGTWFEVPTGSSGQIRTLRGLIGSSGGLEDALQQVVDYCNSRGVPVGAVTNGHQWVAFIATRTDGIPPLSGRALVYSSLRDMRENFQPLWDSLSPQGLRQGTLSEFLRSEVARTPPPKLSFAIPDYPGYQRRNILQQRLQTLGEMFLEDLYWGTEHEEEFLRRCYSPSGALSQYAMVSREILKSRYSELLESELGTEVEPATMKDGVTDELRAELELLERSITRRPIILLGDVGAGKTTFIRNLINVEAKDILDRSVTLYVDFGTQPAIVDDLDRYLADQVVRQLRDVYEIDVYADNFVRGVYHGELEGFRNGIYGRLRESEPDEFVREEIRFLEELTQDVNRHLDASLHHIRWGQERQIVIFLDNIDQRPPEFQERAFLNAQSMAGSWPVTVFVSIRPETFNASKAKGSLDAYQHRVFSISPPRIDEVVERRLAFALDMIQSDKHLPLLPEGIEFRSSSLESIIDILQRSLRRNRDLAALIDNLSGGNVRKALVWLQGFIGSGHVDTEKILRIYEEQGQYLIPVHEFLRAVLIGESRHYDPAASPITNVFSITTSDPAEHFLLPILVSTVERLGQTNGDQGFVEAERILDHCYGLGYARPQVQACLERCISKGLLEASPREQGIRAHHLRITSAGAYSIHVLPTLFSYVDAVIVDTPITDDEARARIRDVRAIEERLERVAVFRGYLNRCWEPLRDRDTVFDWDGVSPALEASEESVRQGLARAAARREAEGQQS